MAMEVSRTSMKVARVTVSAMAHGLCLGFQFPSMPGDIGGCVLEWGCWLEDAGKVGMPQERILRETGGEDKAPVLSCKFLP